MLTIAEKIVIYRECVKQWGMEAQLNMAVEETAELISALQHYRRLRQWGHPATIEDIADEIADVEIMTDQLKFMFDIDSEHLLQIKEKKLNRVKELLGLT